LKKRRFSRRFVVILAVYAVSVLCLWLLYHNVVFSNIRQNALESIDLVKNRLLSELDNEFSHMNLVSSVLAGSIYVQEFLAEKDVSIYYEKAGAVSEIIRKTAYANITADSIITVTVDGSIYRFTGSISSSAVSTIYREIISNGMSSYSIVELDGTDFFCLIAPVYSRGLAEVAPVGHIVMLSNLARVRRTVMESQMDSGIDAAVISGDSIIFSSNPMLDGRDISELERLYGGVTVMQVSGSNLYAAAAITNEAMYFGERLFITVSAVLLVLLLITVGLLYRTLSARMVRPMLENADKMQMGLLKTQIKAHFVVNTIVCIESLAKQGENEKAAAAAGNLAGLLVKLHESNDEVNIIEVMENLNRYIEIMNIRNNDKFEVIFDIDDRLSEYRMPENILQPLVENALTHGLGNKETDCLLTVTGKAEDGCVVFEVSDNGKGMTPETIRAMQDMIDDADEWDYSEYSISGVALVNIQKRIKALYGGVYGLSLNGTLNEGVTFIVRLPMVEDV